MKRLITVLILVVLVACTPAPFTLVPAETLAAQTFAAMPRTDTPTPVPSDTPNPTPTPDESSPTPGFNESAPGAHCIPIGTQRTRALVTRVLDAQTIEVATGNENFTVRYIGLDAPGIAPNMDWKGAQAVAANDNLVNGKYVTLVKDVSDIDSEGFYLRYVLLDDVFVNYSLIRQGMARVAVVQPDVTCESIFLAAQVEAQTARSGIWEPTPVPTVTRTSTATITPIPTSTSVPPCACRSGLSCNNFYTQAQAQQCYNYCLKQGYGPVLDDKNKNGRVCEGLP